jgi:2-dehydro-3-deoxygluconokinase
MNSATSGPILCFGEMLLRLSATPGTRLSNIAALSAHVAGAEANVAAMLAQLGHDMEMITVLPRSPLGDLCEAELRRSGCGVGRSIRADGRLGLYFLEHGQGRGRIVYDRGQSAFSEGADRFDWPALAAGARWLHVSGITLALGERAAESALNAVAAMRSAGATVSFDVNHRSALWDGRPGQDLEPLRQMIGSAEILFASVADLSRVLGTELPDDTAEDRRRAAQKAFAAFEGLRLVASTRRTSDEDRQRLCARVDRRDGGHETDFAPLGTIVDRIGSGDAFAGAVIDCVLGDATLEAMARAALAAAVMKHGIAGDRWIGTRDDLDSFDPFAASDIRR